MRTAAKLVLASGSARRIELLNQAGVSPDIVQPTDIDETPHRAEHPRNLAYRLSRAKAANAAERLKALDAETGHFILAADTVVAVGRRVLPKAETLDEAEACLALLSGRSHRVYSGLTVMSPQGKITTKVVETRVRFKRLSAEEEQAYLASGEWRGKAGGYAIQGLAGTFVVKLVGSYSNVVGLPLYETIAMLTANGYRVHASWFAAGRPAEEQV